MEKKDNKLRVIELDPYITGSELATLFNKQMYPNYNYAEEEETKIDLHPVRVLENFERIAERIDVGLIVAELRRAAERLRRVVQQRAQQAQS